MVAAVRQHRAFGLVALILSSAAFGTSGPFAKSLIGSGWSPGAVVLLRITGAALVLLPLTLWTLRGQWRTVRGHLPLVAAYGILAVAGAQLGYFQAVERLSVGVALLIEYLGIVLVVLFMWILTRRRPHGLTFAGVALAIVGLALVLDVLGATAPDPIGVLWGMLAATGLAGHYVIAARKTSVPAVAFAGLGLLTGSITLGALGLTGVVPMTFATAAIHVGGLLLPWWLGLLELVLVAAVLAYILGIVGARALGSTLSSFVGLTEVLFAILFAWFVLGELPRPVQLLGGLLILAGVLAVQWGEREDPRHPHDPAEHEPDFAALSPVA